MYKLLGFATSFFKMIFFTEQELINTKWHSSFFYVYTIDWYDLRTEKKNRQIFSYRRDPNHKINGEKETDNSSNSAVFSKHVFDQ